MRCEVSNKIYITDPSDDVKSWCKNNLVLNNPDYYKKQKMGKWTGNTPSTLSLYEVVGNVWQAPFGCLQTLYHNLYSICEFIPKFGDFRRFDYKGDIRLYDYQ